jgi:acyl-CoA thioesterase I
MKSSSRRPHVWCSLAASIVAIACGSDATPVDPTPVADPPAVVRRVVVLGDSLAVHPSAQESFPAMLQRRIDRRALPWTVLNAGVAGDTTGGGLRRVDEYLESDVGVLVLALGANDGLRRVSISTIESNLSRIVERAQVRGVRVLLCGMETPPTHGWDYTVEFHRVFPRVATEYSTPLVPFLLAGVALVPEMNGPDGFHPNAAGAQRIADTIWPYLEPLLTQPFGTTAAGIRRCAGAGFALCSPYEEQPAA